MKTWGSRGVSEFTDDIAQLREQLAKGAIRRAYVAIVGYMSQLRAHFAGTQGERAVSSLYQGSLDMTYFALFPPSLAARDLKLAVVFNYEAFCLEVWLAARNRKVQRRYWQLFSESDWSAYRVVEPSVGVDAIVVHDIAGDFDLEDPGGLTGQVEAAVTAFLIDVEGFLSAYDPR